MGSSKDTIDTLLGSCQQTGDATLSVVPSESSRAFVWLSKDEVRIGEVPPDARIVEKNSNKWSEISLTLDSSSRERWPVPITISITAKSGRHFSTSLAATFASSVRRLLVAEEPTEIRVTAAHHHPFQRALPNSNNKILLGRVILDAYPVVDGKIVETGSKAAVFGAIVSLPSGELLATTDSAGSFSAEIDADWPGYLVATHPTYGMGLAALPARPHDTQLGSLELSPTGSVRVTLSEGPRPAHVEIFRVGRIREGNAVASRAPGRDDEAVLFERLPRGSYDLLLSGPGPFQRFAGKVVVRENAVTPVRVKIEPFRLNLEIVRGDSLVPGARLKLVNSTWGWPVEISLAEGKDTFEAWQGGEFGGPALAPGNSAASLVVKNIEAAGEASWRIELPNGILRGRVFDARTGTGRSDTAIRIQVDRGDGSTATMSTKTAQDGRFELRGLDYGRLTLNVDAPRSKPVERFLTISETDREKTIDIELEPSETQAVEVVDSKFRPIAGAVISQGPDQTLIRTDAAGHFEISLDRGDRKTLYVVPQGGSFAVVQLSGSEDSGSPKRIIVPDGTASILLRAQDDRGAPISNIHLIMRFNGNVLPDDLVELLMNVQGNIPFIGADGSARLRNLPPGVWEFWPYMSPDEAEQIKLGLGPAAPVQVGALPGENRVTMTFAKSTP